jgi:hypothetical protein
VTAGNLGDLAIVANSNQTCRVPLLIGAEYAVRAAAPLEDIAASGADTLLGYCWKAPLDHQGGVQIVGDWCANRASMGDVAAWMKANDRRSGRNACAIRILQNGKIEYRYFRKDGRSWGRNKYTEITEELDP